MDNQINEGLNSQNQDGQTDDQNVQQNPEVVAQKNKELFERAKKAEDKLKDPAYLRKRLEEMELNNVPVQTRETVSATPVQSEFSINDFLEMRRAKLSDEEIAEVVSEAKNLGTTPQKLMASEGFKLGLEAKRQKREVEQTTLSPSHRPLVTQDKTWDELSPQERAKDENIRKAREALQTKRERGK